MTAVIAWINKLSIDSELRGCWSITRSQWRPTKINNITSQSRKLVLDQFDLLSLRADSDADSILWFSCFAKFVSR
jgi:hypothetical protein